MKKYFVFFLLFIFVNRAMGQDGTPAEDQDMSNFPKLYSELGIGAGGFLPFGIFSVRNDYPAWWLRYGHNLGTWRVEYRFHHVNAEGVTWYAASAAIGGLMDLYDLARMFFYVGVTQHYYKPQPTNIRELPFALTTGMHVGVSPMFALGGPVYLRSDFQMNFGPGQSLFAGIGFSYLY